MQTMLDKIEKNTIMEVIRNAKIKKIEKKRKEIKELITDEIKYQNEKRREHIQTRQQALD